MSKHSHVRMDIVVLCGRTEFSGRDNASSIMVILMEAHVDFGG